MQTLKLKLLATSLFSSVALVGLAPGVAAAQEDAAEASTNVEELIVTGSRIPRPNLEQPTPVTTVTEAQILNSGTSSLGDVLAQLPALSSSGTVRANSDGGADVGGLSFPDLRNLGTARTLTLVNGKRHVAGDAGDTAVDLGSIPTALVERVEVITGGASAIYGSDAVTGVLNIILKDDFEGYEVNIQGLTPWDGEYGRSWSAYATGGWNFAGDRGNVTLTASYDNQQRVMGSEIRALRNWASIENPADTGPNDGIPDRLYKPNVQTEFFHKYGDIIHYNPFTGALTPITGFDAAGNPVGFPPRIGDNNLFYGAFAENCATCYDSDAGATIIPRFDRWALASTFRYDLTENIRFKGDVKYVESNINDTFSPSFVTNSFYIDPSQQFGGPPDNAFITPEIQALIDQDPSAIYFLNRINEDIGGRNSDTTRKTFRVVGSLEGEFDAGFSDMTWEASYNFGRTKNRFDSKNGLIPGNFNAAIDAVRDASGQIRCRMDVPSQWYAGYAPPDPTTLTGEACVPFNLFGAQNSRAAMDYVTYESTRTHTITQQVASLLFGADTARFLNLPGGPISLAGGLEYRKEESKNINDPFVQSGITESAPQPNATGSFNVKEAFIEFEAPILRDQPGFHRLSLDGAVRFADYSHAGQATAWKLGGVWAPISDLTFRGTYSKAVRAPNIVEAFSPATPGFFSVFDPCEAGSLAVDPDRAANCAALGVTFDDATDNNFPGVASGNVNLHPEKAETYTVGFVYQPSWLTGLSLTVDYYSIEIDRAITLLDPQDAADKCVDGPDLATEYCDLIIRDPVTRQIVSVESSYLNQSALTTAGWDVQLGYARNIGEGRLTGSLNLNYLEKLRVFAFEDYPDVVDKEEGEIGDPRISFVSSLSYNQGPWTLTWESQFLSKSRRSRDTPKERTDRPFIEEVWYHDLIARYQVDFARGAEVYVGVNNIFDKDMPVTLTGNASIAGDTAYDLFGRQVFAGVRARF
ncbi:MAG: TonB-dependent receptor [Caulobacteraceae bacterium]|nr:TonB-dependent receptor [Caulobacteraceae bacterium]